MMKWLFTGLITGLLLITSMFVLPVWANDTVIQRAYESKNGDVQVNGSGRVVHILADDNQGSRHQKFILKLNSGLTLLVAHNIDLAPRVSNLRVGDYVEFYGEYEWSKKGGVIHWTHADPAGRHAEGWLKHDGTTYK